MEEEEDASKTRGRKRWSTKEDEALKEGFEAHGSNWMQIREDNKELFGVRSLTSLEVRFKRIRDRGKPPPRKFHKNQTGELS